MADIVDLSKARDARDKPHADFIKHDEFGREMQAYLTEYAFEGSGWWCSIVWAYSLEDAKARVHAMRQSLILKGQIMDEILA